MILEIDNVELYFKTKRVLNGIYIKAETGRITGILGSNGSGKSCLLNIAFGNLKPKYKLVRIDNKPILKPLYQTGFVKILSQQSFLPRMRLKTIFKLYKVDWRAFVEKFEGFKKFENTAANKLSGGERRVVEVYHVLKSKGEIILLDEPFSQLAPIYVEVFQEIIKEEKTNKIILMTDHMYRHIVELCDDIYLLKNGCSKKIDNLTELEDYKYLSIGSL